MSVGSSGRGAVALRGVGLRHRYGSVEALRGVDVAVRCGEVLALLGANGAGKTTLLRALCGLLRPLAGEVTLEVGGGLRRREAVGWCPQGLVVWESLTCMEQVEFMASMQGVGVASGRRRGLALLEALGLGEVASRQAGQLSGGMQRRLSVALALVHDPPVLALDEPEAGLDPESRWALRRFVQEEAHGRGRAVVISTHHVDEASRVADRVVVLARGRVVGEGTPEEVARAAGAGSLEEALRALSVGGVA